MVLGDERLGRRRVPVPERRDQSKGRFSRCSESDRDIGNAELKVSEDQSVSIETQKRPSVVATNFLLCAQLTQ